MKKLYLFLTLLGLQIVTAAEWHVAISGNDDASGTATTPLKTIQRAADLALPGDVITVHTGVYRERINPPRGGESNAKRIVYQAAAGEKVEIKGSEVIKGWTNVRGDVWTVTLPNTFFGGFNPYSDLIQGAWFLPKDRLHHPGAVYLNGEWLNEAAEKDEVLKSVGTNALWFGNVGVMNTTLWAQFKGVNPNEQLVEINVRQSVFYPDQPGRNFITVRSFTLRQAATPWAPPNVEQVGLIGVNWSRGWIIEDNIMSDSACCGISLGIGGHGHKGGDKPIVFAPGASNAEKSKRSADGSAYTRDWNKANVGSHIVRNNEISRCEQAGIVGLEGAVFSVITGNSIHDIHMRRLFSGWEMAGIKFHDAVDVEISHNHIYRTWRGIWFDGGSQGSRINCNLLHDNETACDIFFEIDPGPILVDNNLLLSGNVAYDSSVGVAYAHNLIAGRLEPHAEEREARWYAPHSTERIRFKHISGGDDRYYNNIFVKPTHTAAWPLWPERIDSQSDENSFGLASYDGSGLSPLTRYPMFMAGNVFLNGAKPSQDEKDPFVQAQFDPAIKVEERKEGFYLRITPNPAIHDRKTELVTTERLGVAKLPQERFENPDGSPLAIDTDYFGNKRNRTNPTPGPFENPGSESLIKIW